jgi:hypothetical protein
LRKDAIEGASNLAERINSSLHWFFSPSLLIKIYSPEPQRCTAMEQLTIVDRKEEQSRFKTEKF